VVVVVVVVVMMMMMMMIKKENSSRVADITVLTRDLGLYAHTIHPYTTNYWTDIHLQEIITQQIVELTYVYKTLL
jgi:flagellar basal body-associated protein FliL